MIATTLLFEKGKIFYSVSIIRKYLLLVIPSLSDMMRVPRCNDSCYSWHIKIIGLRRGDVKENRFLSLFSLFSSVFSSDFPLGIKYIYLIISYISRSNPFSLLFFDSEDQETVRRQEDEIQNRVNCGISRLDCICYICSHKTKFILLKD